ncbi:MAG: Flp pilus assembly protein CpaB [Armatimonadota bacterium]|nr:Flp pilus assembly protein CpaB [Armatimonadota bacterium]MDW8142437.1 Flp pilus assembly protein CpaB [Armatimonadota bacterium]
MPQRRMLLLAAVVCASVALLATLWLNRRGQAPSAPPTGQEQTVKKIPVVVAARDLEKGARLSSADVRIIELPEDQVPKDAVTDMDLVANSILLQRAPKDLPLRLSQLMPPPEQLREFSVPLGMRGFVLYQPFTEGAADILLPGDLVDVIGIRRHGEMTIAEVIARRAQVLVAENYVPGVSREEMVRQRILSRVSQTTPAPPETQKVQPQPTQPTPESETKAAATMRRIVLAVTPAEAVRLARALEEGRTLTVLRNERDYFMTPPLRSPEKIPSTSPPQPAPTRPVAQQITPTRPFTPARVIVVYRGTEREEVIFSRQ